jgi:glycosyltransferase involved in cell wall biosynthesis
MAKVLFFFTSSYPFGNGETFIENEIEYLAKAFDKIVIVSNETQNKQIRLLPDNVSTTNLDYELPYHQKVISYLQIFNPIFWQEIKCIRIIYKQKITLPILNTMLQTLQKSNIFRPFINSVIELNTAKNDQIFLYSYWNNDMAYTLSSFKTKKMIVKGFSRMHGWDVYFEANAIGYLPFRKYIFEKLDCVFAISDKGKNYYLNQLPENNNKINVSRLGVKHNGFNPMSETKTMQLLTISNIIPIKNLYVLVDALALLNFDFRWMHIGDGFLHEDLEKYAQQKIPYRFIFMGSISNKEVITFISNKPIDLLMNVSLSEGIPVSIMEAMSFGIPCLAPAVGGIPEIVNDENGFLLDPNPTPEQIAETIMRYYNLSSEQKEIKRQAAYNTWKEKYNAEKNYTNFVNQILSL